MNELPFTIRRLLVADAEVFRSIRLEGLQQAAEAFGSTFEKEAAQPDQYFIDRVSRNAVFGGFAGEKLVGVAGFYPMDGPKEKHKGVLWGMYVRPEARGTGLAAALVEQLLEYASTHVEQVQLTVVSNIPRARRFYQRLGFIEYGLERKALKQNGVYFDEVLMVKFLDRTINGN